MTKGPKKTNTKGKDSEATKKVKKAEIAKIKSTAKVVKAKRTPTTRNYFSVHEDSQILEAIEKGGVVVSSAAKALAAVLAPRTVEAIRDRIKRYLKNLPAADKNQIHAQAKKNPKGFAYFKKVNKDRRVEKFSNVVPSLQNRDLIRRPRTSKKTGIALRAKPKVAPDEKYKWITSKLTNKDSYFKLEFSVQFLADIFNVLIEEHGVSQHDINAYIQGVHCDQTLSSILEHFNVKKN